jgi:2-C-methyl-D-erythritol 4-phosphate cytidylyltransferase
MNSDIPKQFMVLDNLPVILHSIFAFSNFDPSVQVVIALPENYFTYWNDICEKYVFKYPHTLSKGGETRFHTVKRALTLIQDDRIVAIHDAVRPLVSESTIELGYRDALTFGNAVPVIPVSESIRWSEGRKNQSVDREHLRVVQTPQVFNASLIKHAYNRITDDSFTDDASVLEAMGETIHLYEGNRENIKITHPDDLIIAEALMKHSGFPYFCMDSNKDDKT